LRPQLIELLPYISVEIDLLGDGFVLYLVIYCEEELARYEKEELALEVRNEEEESEDYLVVLAQVGEPNPQGPLVANVHARTPPLKGFIQ
jgi:hypothetical protein